MIMIKDNLTAKEKLDIIIYRTGMTIDQVADVLGKSSSYIGYILNPSKGSKSFNVKLDKLLAFANRNHIVKRKRGIEFYELRVKLCAALIDNDFGKAKALIIELSKMGDE